MVAAVKPGTQAQRHPALRAGLVVIGVGSAELLGSSIDDVIDVIAGSPQRPLEFRFSPSLDGAMARRAASSSLGSSARTAPVSSGGSSSPASPNVQPDSEFCVEFTEPGSIGIDLRETENGQNVEVGALKLDTQAMQHRGQLFEGLILTGIGTEDVSMWSIDDVVDRIIDSGRPLKLRFAQPRITVTFTDQGSVGLDLVEEAGAVVIEEVKPGTQAQRHPNLRTGLVVIGVGGIDVRGKSMDNVVDMIIGHPQRPLEFSFSLRPKSAAGTAVSAAQDDKLDGANTDVDSAPLELSGEPSLQSSGETNAAEDTDDAASLVKEAQEARLAKLEEATTAAELADARLEESDAEAVCVATTMEVKEAADAEAAHLAAAQAEIAHLVTKSTAEDDTAPSPPPESQPKTSAESGGRS